MADAAAAGVEAGCGGGCDVRLAQQLQAYVASSAAVATAASAAGAAAAECAVDALVRLRVWSRGPAGRT